MDPSTSAMNEAYPSSEEKQTEIPTSDESLEILDTVNDDNTEHKGRVVSQNNVSYVPNGGTLAWLQVLGAHFLFFNSWGIVNTFGSYEAYYQTGLLSTSTPSAISWIGSIQAFLLLFVGAITGPVYDLGYSRTLIMSGSLLMVFGQMMLSLCEEYYQVLLAQGICMGIGCGLVCVPSTAIVSQYFSTKIATAVGIVAAGSSFGGIIYPIVFHRLQPSIGFPWTTRVIGFIMLGTQLISLAVYRVRVLPDTKRSIIDFAAFKEPPYAIFVSGMFLCFMGLYQPFFYIQEYAIDAHLTNPNLGFYVLSIMNAASAFGRILPGMLSDIIGPLNVMVPCAFVAALLCLCLIAAHNSDGVIVLAGFYGFFSGTFISSASAVIVHLSAHTRDKIGTRLGQLFGVASFAMLISTPIGGVVLDDHGYTSLWIFSGVFIVGSGAFIFAARVVYKGFQLMIKA